MSKKPPANPIIYPLIGLTLLLIVLGLEGNGVVPTWWIVVAFVIWGVSFVLAEFEDRRAEKKLKKETKEFFDFFERATKEIEELSEWIDKKTMEKPQKLTNKYSLN